jgi:signal transduction histidine kinase
LAGILRDRVDGEAHHLADLVASSCDRLVDEIMAQKELVAAESGDLEPTFSPANSREVLDRVLGLARGLDAASGRNLRLDPEACQVSFVTEPRLLIRVLVNMVKNGLEAVSPGQTVELGCDAAGDGVRFRVRNPGHIPPEVQMQIFQRSFSTKGSGRGLGTYSIRLLTERYLGGRAGFTTSPEQGVEFAVVLPDLSSEMGL